MTTLATAPPAAVPFFTWPSDVLAHAREHGVEQYLDPLLAATRRLFPTALTLGVHVTPYTLDTDPGSLVFEVRVLASDIPDYREAVHRWNLELLRIYPPPIQFAFLLDLGCESP